MFYSNSNNYMQDLYAYNQLPQNNTYNPFMGNTMPSVGNENVGFTNMNGMFMPMNTQNPNMFQGNTNMSNQNQNNLYPSIYRIINPVVNRVVSRSNIPYLTEDALNNMVDTVYNIVEGQIDLEDQIETTSQNEVGNRGTTTTTMTNTQNPPTNINTRTTTTTDTRNTMNTMNTTTNNQATNLSSSNRRRNRNDSLLRDLIKILILRQIFSRNWMSQMPFNYQNNYQNQFAYNPNIMSF